MMLTDHIDQTVHDGRHQHLEKLTFVPEHIHSDINTLFSTKSTTRIPIPILFLQFDIILTMLSRWLTSV